ncbi:MAG: DUF4345 domain-containing protein [Bacteroidota bacterium]
METFKIVVLSLSGLALFYASSMRLINPNKANFLKTYIGNSEIKLEKDTDLLNEIRGIGSVMLLGGILVLMGTIMPDFKQTSFVVASLIFGGVVLGRLISFGLDGIPNADIIRAAIIEVTLCVLNLFCLVSILRN